MGLVVAPGVLAAATAGAVLAAAVAGLVAVRYRRTAGRALARAEAYRLSFDHALVGLAVLRLDPPASPAEGWLVEHANPALAHLVCRDVDGRPWHDVLAGPDRRDAARTLAALADGRLPAWHGEHTVDVAGRSRRVHVSMATLPAVAGRHRSGVSQRLAVQVVDVTERAAEQVRLRDLALHDPLTGLPNRALLADRLELALAGTTRTGGRVLVAFCDLDDFKAVNDGSGHAAGDQVLVTVAARLRDAVRPADTVARVGGDEFVVLCPDVPDEAVAAEIADRLLAALRAPVLVAGVDLRCGGSVGVALSAAAAGRRTAASRLLHAADVAMYRAKRSGKDAVRLVTADPDPVEPDGVTPDGMTPDGMIPDGMIPDEVVADPTPDRVELRPSQPPATIDVRGIDRLSA